MSADLPAVADEAAIRRIEQSIIRAPCPWCVGVGGDPRECVACNGNGWFVTEANLPD